METLLNRLAFFWDTTQRLLVIPWRRFGKNYGSNFQDNRLEDGTDMVVPKSPTTRCVISHMTVYLLFCR